MGPKKHISMKPAVSSLLSESCFTTWCLPSDPTIGVAESTAAGTTSSSTASQNASPGCHGKGKDFFFQNKDWCISELVRGIPEYLQAHPGFIWNLAFMGECFEYATCTGGLSFVE